MPKGGVTSSVPPPRAPRKLLICWACSNPRPLPVCAWKPVEAKKPTLRYSKPTFIFIFLAAKEETGL